MPPVDTSSKRRATRPRPSSTRPVLSETESSARRGTGTRASARSRSIRTRRPSGATRDRAGQEQGHGRAAAGGARPRGSVRAGAGRRRRAGPRRPPGRRSGRRRGSRPRDGPCSRSRRRRGPGHRPRRGRPGTRAAGSDACSGSGRRTRPGRPVRRCACSRPARRRRATTLASVSASVASSPPGTRAVSIPCSAAQSSAAHGRSANTSTIDPPSSPRAAAAWSACRFVPAPETPTAIAPGHAATLEGRLDVPGTADGIGRRRPRRRASPGCPSPRRRR